MLADVSFEDIDGISIAHVRGEVDRSNAPDLGLTLQEVIQHRSTGLILDFTETSYLDSAGLHFIFNLGKRLRDRGQLLELVVPPGSPVAPVLEVVGVESMAPVAASLDAALEHMREHAAGLSET